MSTVPQGDPILRAYANLKAVRDNLGSGYVHEEGFYRQYNRALDELQQAGIKTFVMIAPMLPGAEDLAEILAGKVEHVILDRLNYHYADWIYRKNRMDNALSEEYFMKTSAAIADECQKSGITCNVVY